MSPKNTFITKKVEPFCDLVINISTVFTIIITTLNNDKIRTNVNSSFTSKLLTENKTIAYSFVIGMLTMSALIRYAIKNNYDITFSAKANKIYKERKQVKCTLLLTAFMMLAIIALEFLAFKGITDSNSLDILFSFSIITMFFFWLSIFDAIVSQKMQEPFGLIIFLLLILLILMADNKDAFILIISSFFVFLVFLLIKLFKKIRQILSKTPKFVLTLFIIIFLCVAVGSFLFFALNWNFFVILRSCLSLIIMGFLSVIIILI